MFYDALFIGKDYWFIIAYAMLCVVSPLLNRFAESVDRSSFQKMLVCFFLFQSIFGWLGGTGGFSDGYSGISFVGLYLAARYFRLYSFDISRPVLIYLGLSVFSTVVIALSMQLLPTGLSYSVQRLLVAYNSPTVVASSIGLFFAFKKMVVQSKLINWFAASALSIYLIHQHPIVFEPVFTPCVKILSEMPCPYLAILLFVLLVCLACILIDKLRMAIENIFFKFIK